MKRLIAFLLIGICLICSAFSESELYTERGCDCQEEPCSCFMQLGDEGVPVKAVISVLKEKGYLKSGIEATYTAAVAEAVMALQREMGLPETGMLDDETLTYLLWGMGSEALDALRPELTPEVVYVPTNGGEKFHDNEKCCGIIAPRKLARRNAEALGLDDCSICYQKTN